MPYLKLQDVLHKKRSELQAALSADQSANPYYQSNQLAEDRALELRKSVRKRDNWYDNPLNFLDPEELFMPDGLLRTRSGLMAIAGEIFRENRNGTPDILEDILHGSLPGSKDVQRTVLMKMLRDVLSAFSKKATRAQIEAIVLAREAELQGKTATVYIAKERNINRHSAYKLLKRAERALLETSGTSSAIIDIEAQIKEQARSLQRFCASCGQQCEDGLHSLCASCHMRFVYKQDYLHDGHRQEVEDAMRLSSIEHWRKARMTLHLST